MARNLLTFGLARGREEKCMREKLDLQRMGKPFRILGRRQGRRTKTRLFVVFQSSLKAKEENLLYVGFTKDISDRDVYFYTPNHICLGDEITMTIYVPASPGQLPPRLESRGIVTRSDAIDESASAPMYGVAVRYSEPQRILF